MHFPAAMQGLNTVRDPYIKLDEQLQAEETAEVDL